MVAHKVTFISLKKQEKGAKQPEILGIIGCQVLDNLFDTKDIKN